MPAVASRGLNEGLGVTAANERMQGTLDEIGSSRELECLAKRGEAWLQHSSEFQRVERALKFLRHTAEKFQELVIPCPRIYTC